MESPAKKSLTESEITQAVVERWKARLLMHGPTSELGRMARHQLRLWEERKTGTA